MGSITPIELRVMDLAHATDNQMDEEVATIRETVGPHRAGLPGIAGMVDTEDKEVMVTAAEEVITCMMTVLTPVVLDAASRTEDDCQHLHSVFPITSGKTDVHGGDTCAEEGVL